MFVIQGEWLAILLKSDMFVYKTLKTLNCWDLQIKSDETAQLLNKPYVSDVYLTRENLTQNHSHSFNIYHTFLKNVDVLMLKIWGLQVKWPQSYQLSKLEVSRKSSPSGPLELVSPVSRLPAVKLFSKFDGQ